MDSHSYGSLAPLYLADLLMGAAYSDSELEHKEVERVKELLIKMTGTALTPTLEQRISTFNPTVFNVNTTVKMLLSVASDVLSSKVEKKKILECLAAVHESNEELAIEEDEYLRKVAAALGLDPQDYSDLTLEIVEEEIRPMMQRLSKPPPLPKR